ncbi:MAG: hypothetical protein V7746_16865 [Halioglobus sp.]
MPETLEVKRLRGTTVVKLILIGNCVGFTLIFAIFGLMASFGLNALKWNGEYITGPVAILAGPLIGLFLGAFLGLFQGAFTYLGLRVYARFRSTELEYIPCDPD